MLVRPQDLEDFVGQETIKNRLSVSLSAAKKEMRLPQHMLFTGPPGLGKTSMASIVAAELGVKFHKALSASIESVKDVIQLLKPFVREEGVLFIDEIHRLDKHIYEFFYSVMEDGYFTLLNEEVKLKDFVLIGASTEEGYLPKPFLDRFGKKLEFERYSIEDLATIVTNYISKTNKEYGSSITLEEEAAKLVAECSQGTPRLALNLTDDVRDYTLKVDSQVIDVELIEESFEYLGIAPFGLNSKQVRYIKLLGERARNVGLQEISVLLGESKETIERNVEPPLLDMQLVERTSNGRALSIKGRTLYHEL